jgi:mono/diheme cytochrome c family protein
MSYTCLAGQHALPQTRITVLHKWSFGLLFILLLFHIRAAASEAQEANAGAKLFHQYCASCHGEKGKGNGPVAPYLTVQPLDLTAIAERRDGTFPEEQIIRIVAGEENPPGHGTRTMPVWGEQLQDDLIGGVNKATVARGRIAFLVDYLQAIQGGGRASFENVVTPTEGLRPGAPPSR